MLVIVIGVCLLVAFVAFLCKVLLTRSVSLEGCHVLITGGSSGIGKSLAIEAVKRGANVALLARDRTKLEAAQTEIQNHANKKDQKVRTFSIDISKDYHEVENVVRQAEAELGPVAVLFNCAGYSVSGRFEELPVEDFQNLLSVNYLGSVYVTKAVLPGMKSQRAGRILFTSSQAGVLGLYGFTAYSASKFALRGLAESLHMEVKPYNISVTLGLPPDTDTPGFAEEEKTKPIETKLISQTSSLESPHDVAKSMMEDTLRGSFLCSSGIVGFLLCNLCAGMAPMTSVFEVITQFFSMGLFRCVGVIILHSFNRIVTQQMKENDQSKKDG